MKTYSRTPSALLLGLIFGAILARATPEELKSIRHFRYQIGSVNHRIRPRGDCEKLLIGAQLKIGRMLTIEEIALGFGRVLDEVGPADNLDPI